jgi:hypothetical protein
MARTTKTPHKVSRNKSGTPIVRASRLFPITKAMKPVRYTNEPQIFEARRAYDPHASAIAATCRWSVPQHPPKTLSSGNRLRRAAY